MASKVLHFRNLPEHASEAEVSAACAPFGGLVRIMTGVGKDHNQAFAEFADINAASQMVLHYSTVAEGLMIRGKQAYVQFSTRQEITNPHGGNGNVLLVTMDPSAATEVTIEMLHATFNTFGFVEKIATFDKGMGFQALVQYNNPQLAQAAKASMDGRPIPQHLAPNMLPVPMRINFSSHNDITVKFQGHKSRDFTNPFLPVASNATDLPQASVAPILPPPSAQAQSQQEGNVLLCVIDDAAYPMTVDPLNTVFSKYGTVEKIAIFEKNSTWQALVQYEDVASANDAKLALEGHAIFEGGYNKLRISTSTHRNLTIRSNNERNWDYTEGKGSQSEDADRGAAASSNEPVITGLDFENAHEALVKMAQQALNQGVATFPSAMPQTAMPMPHHHHMVPGMAQQVAGTYRTYTSAAALPAANSSVQAMPPPWPF